jgi:hypothetical protein
MPLLPATDYYSWYGGPFFTLQKSGLSKPGEIDITKYVGIYYVII